MRQTGVDWDDKGQKKAIFKIQGENKTWAKHVDKEQGNYDYLSASSALFSFCTCPS